jgi:hypothetical protein
MSQTYGQGGTTEQIRGTVEQANEKGLKVGGRWFNFSQYSRTTVRPQEGDQVELEVARGKFINDLRVTGGSLEPALAGDDDLFGDGEPAPAPRATRPAAAPSAAAGATAAGTAGTSDRNTEIRRLALIKAAADFAARRDGLEPDDVTAIAAQWEAWVVGQS